MTVKDVMDLLAQYGDVPCDVVFECAAGERGATVTIEFRPPDRLRALAERYGIDPARLEPFRRPAKEE